MNPQKGSKGSKTVVVCTCGGIEDEGWGMWSELTLHPSSAPTSLSCLGCPQTMAPSQPPTQSDIQHVPCPFPQLLLPWGLVGSKREEFLARNQGRCPGRREAVHAHARDRSGFQLPRAGWERAKRGRGGPRGPSSREPGGQGEPGEGPEGQKELLWAEP